MEEIKNGEDSDFQPTSDVGAQRVAHVYAEALLNAAEKPGQTEGVLEELHSLVHDLFPAKPELEAFLASGAVGRDRKAHLIQAVFDKRASDVFTNFLLVLNQHERLDLLRPILTAALEIRDQRARRIRVQVRSAVPLPEDQANRLRQRIREAFQLEPIVQSQVDPDLLGGVVVKVGDWLYDASVRSRLESIRNQLIAKGSHEIQSRRDRFSIASGN
jgi:F-type H+-transporting ATPase subunit delta